MTEMLKKYGQRMLPWLGITAVLYIMTALQAPLFLRNLWLVISTAICLFFLWKEQAVEKWEIAILMLGLLGRVTFCYLDVFTEFHLPIGGGDDGIGFWDTALQYYHGNYSEKYTNYPYILNVILHVAGINQFAAQYANILCWGFSLILLQKCCKRLEIDGNLRLVSLAVFAWLPSNIWITSILYRDAYIIFLLLLSFYWLLVWMQEYQIRYLLGTTAAVLAATMLHGASILAMVPVVFAVLFYSHDKKQFLINKKAVIATVGILLFLAVLFVVPQTRNTILRKIPNMDGGLIEGLNRYLENKYDGSVAKSDYLTGRYLTGYFDLIPMTLQRIYYHTFSPTPDMWRGITDVGAFFLSTAPVYLLGLLLWFGSYFFKKIDAYRLILFLEVFVTIGVYSWGNKNAGSALRHREKILSMVILLAAYSLKIILQNRKEQKKHEKIKNKQL